jgi:hypothetical protein
VTFDVVILHCTECLQLGLADFDRIHFPLDTIFPDVIICNLLFQFKLFPMSIYPDLDALLAIFPLFFAISWIGGIRLRFVPLAKCRRCSSDPLKALADGVAAPTATRIIGVKRGNTVECIGHKMAHSSGVDHGEGGRGVELLQLLIDAM